MNNSIPSFIPVKRQKRYPLDMSLLKVSSSLLCLARRISVPFVVAVALGLNGCSGSDSSITQSATVNELGIINAQDSADSIFERFNIKIPDTYITEAETDERVRRYCKGFSKSAYIGVSKKFSRPLAVFIHRVYPQDGRTCAVYGTFARPVDNFPKKLYPFRGVFNGTTMQVATNNFQEIGEATNLLHSMKIDGYVMQYRATYLDEENSGDPLIEAELFDVSESVRSSQQSVKRIRSQ